MSKTNTFPWQRVVQIGLIGGVIGVLIALVGMVEEFDQRDIVAGVISMGQTLLVLTVLLTASAAARAAHRRNLSTILAGVLSGVISAVVLALLALTVENLDLRTVLVNASPTLVEILTFGKGAPTG